MQAKIAARTEPFCIGVIKTRRGEKSTLFYDPLTNIICPDECCVLNNLYPASPGWWLIVNPDTGFKAVLIQHPTRVVESHKLTGIALVNILKSRKEFSPSENLAIVEAKLEPCA